MGIFGQNRYAPAKRDALAPPTDGLRRYLFLVGTHFSKLVTLNLLFLAFSLPVFTIPGALCACSRVCLKLWREGNCILWDAFWKEFRASFLKSIPCGLLFGVALAGGLYGFGLAFAQIETLHSFLFGVPAALALLAAIVIGAYTFALFAMQDLPGSTILKNAVCLAMLEGKRDLLILAVSVGMGAFAILLWPLSLLAIALIWLSLWLFALCAIGNGAIQKRVIEPTLNPAPDAEEQTQSQEE